MQQDKPSQIAMNDEMNDILTIDLKTARQVMDQGLMTYKIELRKALEHIDCFISDRDSFNFCYSGGQVYNIPGLFKGRFRDDLKISLTKRGFQNVKVTDVVGEDKFRFTYSL